MHETNLRWLRTAGLKIPVFHKEGRSHTASDGTETEQRSSIIDFYYEILKDSYWIIHCMFQYSKMNHWYCQNRQMLNIHIPYTQQDIKTSHVYKKSNKTDVQSEFFLFFSWYIHVTHSFKNIYGTIILCFNFYKPMSIKPVEHESTFYPFLH